MRAVRKIAIGLILTFVALHPESEVHVPLWHAYLHPKCEDTKQTRRDRNVNAQHRLPMGPR
jgi:hypothetical protein